MSLRALFRADGGAEIGDGHLMRCFALAQYIQDRGGACRLLTHERAARALAVWQAERLPVDTVPAEPGGGSDADATIAAANEMQADWIVLDGYRFTDAYHSAIVRRRPYLAFDDACESELPADIVVNQNPGAERRCPARPGALLGCRYVMLRRPLREQVPPRARAALPHLLVTLGGYDPDNLALQIGQALLMRSFAGTMTVVCAAGSAGLDAAHAWASGCRDRVEVMPPGDLVPAMRRADLAICAGGTTSLELASLGVPMVVVVVADNQRDGARALAASGCAVVAGEGGTALTEAADLAADLAASPARRNAMADRGRALVDGRGVERVVDAMQARP